jgi:Transcriptional activator, adenine-specific DNA methyltransferase
LGFNRWCKNLKIIINPEYDTQVTPISDEDLQVLKESIRELGLKEPILVNPEGEIISGHNRFRICQELGIAPKYETVEFPTKLDEKIFVTESNILGRHMNSFLRVYNTLTIKPELEKQARENSLSNLKQNTPSDRNLTLGRVNTIIGKKTGVSRDTVMKVEFIKPLITDEEFDKLSRDKLHIDRAYQKYNRKEYKPAEIPFGKYDAILADPPWQYDVELRGSAENQYPTMTDEEIENYPIPSAENCVLFLWSTVTAIKRALKVMDKWGFTYKTGAVWVKNRIGTGFYFRGRHELLLLGVKGKLPTPEQDDRPDSVIEAPTGKHSEKPKIVYDIIENMYPDRQYTELFSRVEKEDQRENWTYWSNE